MNSAHTLLGACWLGMFLMGCAVQAPPLPPTATPEPLDQNAVRQNIEDYLARRARRQEFSGVVLVARNGAVILEQGYGLANVAQNIANTPDTRFQLASVAKTLTATAVMQLVERGRIRLAAPISTFLNDTPRAWNNITVEQLLAHTSGIPDYFSFDEFENELQLTPDGIIAVAKNYPLDFEPGSDFEYSNTGYVLLGKILEQVSGASYAEFLRANILDPLAMNATGREGENAPRAVGYVSNGMPAQEFPITNALGDGDLLATARDMYKFDRALYDDSFLPRAAREKMFAPVGKNHYGLGWETQTWRGKRVVSHSGSINGFATEFMRFPDDDAVIIVLSNWQDVDAAQTAWQIAARLFPQ